LGWACPADFGRFSCSIVATLMQSIICMGLISIAWIIVG
jgi:hypothetical protein